MKLLVPVVLWMHIQVGDAWQQLPGEYMTQGDCEKDMAMLFEKYPDTHVGYFCFPKGMNPNERGL